MALFHRNREFADLEARLRGERPQAPEDLVTRLGGHASPVVPRRGSGRVRYGLAAGFAATFVVAAAALGGSALFSGSTASERVVVSVPAKAVPAIRKLQAEGVILAASPVQVKKGAPATGDVKGVVLEPASSDVGAATAAASAKSGSGTSLVVGPVQTVGATLATRAVTRLPAAVVYVPGTFIPVCYPMTFPPDPNTYYLNLLVPPNLIGNYVPPGSYGFCPTV